jgi:hypothetical protein
MAGMRAATSNRNTTRVVGWHPRSARLVEWLAAEVERRGGGRGVQSDILDEALIDLAAKYGGPVAPKHPRRLRTVPARKITVELTREQAEALRLAADYILYGDESPTTFGWSPGTVKALQNAHDILGGKVSPPAPGRTEAS